MELSYTRRGRRGAPVLVLAPSLGTTGAMWDPQLAALGEQFDLIAIDHRGHGGSPVTPGPYAMADLGHDVVALLDRLGLERVAYCGISIGGMIGQWLAVHHPERLRALVLICTAARVPMPEAYRDRAATVRKAGTPEAVADAVLARWFTPRYAGGHRELMANFRAMIAATSAEGYAGCCEAIAGMDLRLEIPGITAPTLVIAGAQDLALPAEHGRTIAQAVPGARFELLEAAAHLASVERADAVTELINDHLGGSA
ncbi:MAG: 3-oxoadipate enol-lactonase [Solirubrobacteraceae bacterium]